MSELGLSSTIVRLVGMDQFIHYQSLREPIGKSDWGSGAALPDPMLAIRHAINKTVIAKTLNRNI